jgi:ribose/xylose/arabinose/galactoside ABC-type transport system permease subunit
MRLRRYVPFMLDNLIWVILAGVIVVFSILSDRYFTQANIINIFVHASVLGILVVGQTFVLLTGNFDLSTESTVGLSAALGVWLMAPAGSPFWGGGLHANPALAIVAMLALGAGIGFVNGTLITRAKVNNFVVTLAMLISLRGAVELTGNGQTISGAPSSFNWLGSANVGIVPISVIVLLGTFAVAHVVVRYRPFGRELYATGGNRQTALASGINPDRRILQVYVLSGILAAFAGWVLAARVQAVPLNLGQGMIFEVFAAAVIGGISLQGGRGSMVGAFGGVLLLAAIDNGLNLLSVNVFWIDVMRGLIILVAVFIDAQKVRYRVPESPRAAGPTVPAPALGGERGAIE